MLFYFTILYLSILINKLDMLHLNFCKIKTILQNVIYFLWELYFMKCFMESLPSLPKLYKV